MGIHVENGEMDELQGEHDHMDHMVMELKAINEFLKH